MLSHDNLTWDALAIGSYLQLKTGQEEIVSYLPLSHVAAQVSWKTNNKRNWSLYNYFYRSLIFSSPSLTQLLFILLNPTHSRAVFCPLCWKSDQLSFLEFPECGRRFTRKCRTLAGKRQVSERRLPLGPNAMVSSTILAGWMGICLIEI